MTIAALAINPTGTFGAPTGGTSEAVTPLSDDANKHEVMYGANSFATLQTIDFSVKRPKVSAASPSGYTQARSTILIRYPITLANGLVTVNTVSTVFASDIETTDAQKLEMRKAIAHMLLLTVLDEYINNQSLA